MRTSSAIIMAALLLVVSTPVWSCICASPTQEEALERADLVFVGTAIAQIEYPFEHVMGDQVTEVVDTPMLFEVEENIKGAKGVHVLIHHGPNSSCGLTFEPGARYKVYASTIPVGGLLPVGPSGAYGTKQCSGTHRVTEEAAN
jgi:hypothetical protein